MRERNKLCFHFECKKCWPTGTWRFIDINHCRFKSLFPKMEIELKECCSEIVKNHCGPISVCSQHIIQMQEWFLKTIGQSNIDSIKCYIQGSPYSRYKHSHDPACMKYNPKDHYEVTSEELKNWSLYFKKR